MHTYNYFNIYLTANILLVISISDTILQQKKGKGLHYSLTVINISWVCMKLFT